MAPSSSLSLFPAFIESVSLPSHTPPLFVAAFVLRLVYYHFHGFPRKKNKGKGFERIMPDPMHFCLTSQQKNPFSKGERDCS